MIEKSLAINPPKAKKSSSYLLFWLFLSMPFGVIYLATHGQTIWENIMPMVYWLILFFASMPAEKITRSYLSQGGHKLLSVTPIVLAILLAAAYSLHSTLSFPAPPPDVSKVGNFIFLFFISFIGSGFLFWISMTVAWQFLVFLIVVPVRALPQANGEDAKAIRAKRQTVAAVFCLMLASCLAISVESQSLSGPYGTSTVSYRLWKIFQPIEKIKR